MRQLTQASFGSQDTTGRTEAAIVADALGAPAVVFALDDHHPGALRVAVASGWDAPPEPVPIEGVLVDALARMTCVELRPVPPSLAATGVAGGLAVRIGRDHRPFALLAVLAPDDPSLPARRRGRFSALPPAPCTPGSRSTTRATRSRRAVPAR